MWQGREVYGELQRDQRTAGNGARFIQQVDVRQVEISRSSLRDSFLLPHSVDGGAKPCN